MDYSTVLFVVFSSIHIALCVFPDIEPPACVLGDIIQNDRTKCLCIDRSIYECFTITNGTKNTGYRNQVPNNDPNVKDSTYQITDNDSNKGTEYKPYLSVAGNKDLTNIATCNSDAIYVQGNTTCVCTRKGTWPHDACFKLFGTLRVNPKNYTKCAPNSYVIVDCNVCYCTNKGRIDKARCTKKVCNKKTLKLTRKNFDNSCEPKTWYSLSACQFCYCADSNKLVCNTGRYNSKRLELGTYNLTVCGSKFLEEAMELMPEEQHLRNTGAKTKKIKTMKSTDRPIVREKTTRENRSSPITRKLKRIRTTTTPRMQLKDEEYYSGSEEATTYQSTNKVSQLITNKMLSENEDNLPSYDNHNELTQKNYDGKGKDFIYDTKNSMQQEDQYGEPIIVEQRPEVQLKSKNFDENDNTFQFGEKNITQPMLTINIPNMISKVFNLRRSKGNATVVLKENKGKPCKPGVLSIEGCNKCFCLKSGKLLCTDKENC